MRRRLQRTGNVERTGNKKANAQSRRKKETRKLWAALRGLLKGDLEGFGEHIRAWKEKIIRNR